MIAQDLISYDVPNLKLESTIDDAEKIMEENKCGHLAVVDEGSYLGIISESEIFDLKNPAGKIKDNFADYLSPSVSASAHIYQVISIVSEFNITCVPVLNEKQEYLGVITLQDLAISFAKITNVNEPGGILILEVKNRDYSLAQAAQIVESDNAKILSSYIYPNDDRLTLNLVLKINKKDLSTIISAFDRYNYIVVGSYHESKFDEDMRDRYDQFMNYLNI